MGPVKILVVEDERAIADFLDRGLAAEGYAVECVYDGIEGERRAVSGGVDLVILDVMLPGRDGLAVLEAIRHAVPGLPVILLTARGEVEDKVAGLDGGATDYVTKPFSFEELASRIRAHLRQPRQDSSTVLELDDLRVDLLAREVTREGRRVHLSTREFDLLVYFVRHAGQVLSREQLLNAVWGYTYDPGTNVAGVYVGYLRKKLAEVGSAQSLETVRGAGYKLTAPR